MSACGPATPGRPAAPRVGAAATGGEPQIPLGLPGVALEAACAALAFSLPLSIALANVGWALVAASLLLCAAAALAVNWRRAKTPLTYPLAACLAASLLSSALARSFNLHALQGDVHRLWLSALFAVAVSALSTSARRRVMAVFGLGAFPTAVSAIGWALYASWVRGRFERARAWLHPVSLGELMAFAALGAAALLFAPDDETLVPRHRRWLGAALALYGATMVFSGTRGALLGFGAGMFAILWLAPGARRHAWTAVLATAAAFAATELLFLAQGRSLLRDWSSGSHGDGQNLRLLLWSVAWRMFRLSPLTGVGPGNYRTFYPHFAAFGADNEATAGNAHNLLAQQLAEQGLAGAACLLWLIAALWLTAWRRAAGRPDAFSLWALGSTAAFLVMNLTEVALHTEQVWMTFFFIWALGALAPSCGEVS